MALLRAGRSVARYNLKALNLRLLDRTVFVVGLSLTETGTYHTR